jgi:DNA-binding response OmpR family regulator
LSDKPRVLVIDDDQSLLRLVKTHLGSHGYHVETAQSGEKGLDILSTFRPALVILDLLLPGLDGFAICRRIRETPEFSGTRVLLLTAVYLSEEDALQGFHMGADAFLLKPDLILSKPVHLKALKEAVDSMVAGATSAPPPGPPPDRILIVDDDERNLRLLKMRFQSEGFEVREAPDGQVALGLLESFQPHLLLTDVKMPVMSGLDLLREARAGGYDGPVMVMTAFGSEAVAVDAFSHGAEDYLIKPFDSATAVRRIRRLIENYRLQKSSDQLTERLKRISIDLVERVNHLELQNQRLEDAYAKVKGLSEFNQRFIKSLSNELRAPLSTLISFASILQETPKESRDPEAEQDVLAIIYRTAFRLEINLSNLIYLSKLQSGVMGVVLGGVDLEPTVVETLALARKSLAREGLEFRWYPGDEPMRIQGERTLLRDLLVNLLDNSILRTDGEGEVTLEVLHEIREEAGGGTRAWACLRIRDTGHSHLEKDLVLTDLEGVDPSSLKEGSETIRLSLCRKLAEAAGWSLDFANRPTLGGEATLRMPLHAP